MKIDIVFHKADPLALDSMSDDDSGLPPNQFCLVKSLNKLGEVMTINLNNVPAKGMPLIIEGDTIHYLTVPVVNYSTVIINDCYQIIQLKVGGDHSPLPYLPLITFAITQQNIYLILL